MEFTGFHLVGTIMTALGFVRLCDCVDSRTITIGTVLVNVIGLLLMLLDY